jgi:Peroxiredoxin
MKHLLSILLTLIVVTLAQAQLPQVKLKDLQNNEVNTSELSNDGKPFILSFFATWCKPCLRELKAIHEEYLDWQEETGVKLVAISIDEGQNADRVKPLVDALGFEYEVLLDPNGDFKRAMNVNIIPHVFIIDGRGRVAYTHSGYSEGGEQELIAKVRELLETSGE